MRSELSGSLKKVVGWWKSLNVECPWNNIEVKWLSVSVQSYTYFRLNLLTCFPS
jgi:hypothetical protein